VIEGGGRTTGPEEPEDVPDVAPPIDLKADPAGSGRGAARRWLLAGLHATSSSTHHATYPWWKVMCLTGVDYFSTLGYQPGIAFLAAGMLSPAATLVLILVTLFVALPIYAQVAAHSPHGQGSILMLEQLLPRWKGKAFVLVLLGFAFTDFIITMTLSAADATAHILENPFVEGHFHHPIGLTLLLLAILGAVFLVGFREAIGMAVAIVAVYLGLNAVLLAFALREVYQHPSVLSDWRTALFAEHGSPLRMLGISLLLFPKLALGLSGFETGVAVMPLVRGGPDDTPHSPRGRIRNTKKLLLSAALIMSVFLLGSSVVTTTLIPAEEFAKGGEANGRALAYLAHRLLGDVFGTIYDLSTIGILWFAGASAMAGLLNLVPRYLPPYGMAPNWARATRPLVLVLCLIAFVVTVLFDADVDAQGGAYATGVLFLMTSAAVAVTIAFWETRRRFFYLAMTVVFAYTTIANIVERPEGIKIAAFFIVAIVFLSLLSRAIRSTELRITTVRLDPAAQRFVDEVAPENVRIIAHRPDKRTVEEYDRKEVEAREDHSLDHGEPVLFLEVTQGDASQFSAELEVHGVTVGRHRLLRCTSAAVPNAIAALLLNVRDRTERTSHGYFGWTEGNPFVYAVRFVALGEGDTAPMTREVLRKAVRDPLARPRIHVG
jgi:amino acid permease-like protein